MPGGYGFREGQRECDEVKDVWRAEDEWIWCSADGKGGGEGSVGGWLCAG